MVSMKLVCTSCPKECNLDINLNNNKIVEVQGNSCKRGIDYAQVEITSPKRILTTTVIVENSKHLLLPVRSSKPLPKEILQRAVEIIRSHKATPPIKRGDVIIGNILDTGIDIVASRSILA